MSETATATLYETFLNSLLDDVRHNRLSVPSLPEVAMKVKEVVEQPDSSADTIAKVVNADPALSARLIRVANSPAYRGAREIQNVREAVTRLGLSVIRHLVNALVMEQLYRSRGSETLRRNLRKNWEHATRVAAISRVLASQHTKLDPEVAMLAGLIHDIGSLPVLAKAEAIPEVYDEPDVLTKVMAKCHPLNGRLILQEWGFPEEIAAVAEEHENLARRGDADIDYVDVVIVANLHSHIGGHHALSQVDLDSVPAFTKFGLAPKDAIAALRQASKEIAELETLLRGN